MEVSRHGHTALVVHVISIKERNQWTSVDQRSPHRDRRFLANNCLRISSLLAARAPGPRATSPMTSANRSYAVGPLEESRAAVAVICCTASRMRSDFVLPVSLAIRFKARSVFVSRRTLVTTLHPSSYYQYVIQLDCSVNSSAGLISSTRPDSTQTASARLWGPCGRPG